MVNAVYLVCEAGEFNVVLVEKWLLNKPYSFKDPLQLNGGPIFVCVDEARASNALNLRLSEVEGSMPCVPFVDVKPGCIFVGQLVADEAMCICRDIVEWVVANYECSISDDNGFDWTEICRYSVDPLYE